MNSLYRYKPARALLFWHVFVLSIFVFLYYELPVHNIELTGNLDKATSNSWFNGFMNRLSTDTFKLAMVWSFMAFFLQGIFHIVSLWVDRYFLLTKSTVNKNILLFSLAAVSGRHLDFYTHEISDNHVYSGLPRLLYPLKQVIPLFPAVGFIGTVIGVSIAISVLPNVIGSSNLSPLMEALYVAFDTTFIGLFALVSLTIILLIIESIRLDLIEELKEKTTMEQR